jgi:type III secretion protein D
MLELRILNGLHRGASLPLDAQPVTIGAAEAADVVLADDGIAADHAQLAPDGASWLLTASDGAIYAADRSEQQALVELAPGDCARVGEIWLCLARQGAPWEAPPPLPEPEAQFDARAEADEARAADGTRAPAPAPPAPAAPRRHRWQRRGVGILLVAVAGMLAATAYALTTRPSLPIPVAAPALTPSVPVAPPAPTRAGAAPADSATALAVLFRKRLADAELLNRFDLRLEPQAWSMQAHLDDEESARFERILNSFIKEHRITFPISARAVTAEAMLPFRISQLISGANASVVTQDGARLYVGDDYRGVRLVAIQANRVTFFGKRKIEVVW